MAEYTYKKLIGLNDDIIKIRTSVFIDEQGFKDEFDETDKTCTHIVLYDEEKPIATSIANEDIEKARETLDRVREFVKNNKTIYCSTHCPEGYLNVEQHKIMEL